MSQASSQLTNSANAHGINLLPPDVQTSYQYARRNSRLLRWVFACLVGLLGLVAISTGGWLYLHQAATNYDSQISIATSALQAQHQGKVDAQAKALSNNVKLAVTILSKEVQFSALLKQLATVTPPNTSLSSITIADVKGGLDISAKTKGYAEATQLQINLADPRNKIFDKADIVNISCGAGSAGSTVSSAYPCTVQLRARFVTPNPFLFINNKPAAGSTAP